jgi:tRNA pseudouridine55 synthase
MTSRSVVDRVLRCLPHGKAGHAGTLDPMASGVLVVCVGTATRLVELVHRLPKTYRSTVRLGARSNTLDAEGVVVATETPVIPTEAEVLRALQTQIGEIRQLPPDFSALRVAGQRAYNRARAGLAVVLEPRLVRIDRIELLEYHWPEVTLEIDCGGGTYIRSIARDLGETLGCGGLLRSLVRTRIGPFELEQAVDLDQLTVDSLPDCLRSLSEAVVGLPSITLDATQAAMVAQGRTLDARRLAFPRIAQGDVALFAPDGQLIALGHADSAMQTVRPRKVLV